jgi:hypothetical protein
MPSKTSKTETTEPRDTLAQTSALARLLGEAAGEAAASWVFDGNTSQETYRKVLDLIAAGDPALDDIVSAPSWLSGEHSDSVNPASLLASLEATEVEDSDADAICTAYEEAADQAFWNHVEQTAKAAV